MRKGNRYLTGFLVGAASAYYLDPELGRGRRAETAQQLAATYHRGLRRALRLVRHTAGESEGLVQRIIHDHPAEPVDDLTLLDRVRSEIYTHPGVHKGELNLEVSKGVVTVHGQVSDEAHIEAVDRAILDVPGVKGLDSLLHVPGTPAPNKLASLRAG